MNDYLIIKYFADDCSTEEEQIVMDWVSESKDNMDYFIKMKNIYVKSTMPDTVAEKSELNYFKTKFVINQTKKARPFSFYSISAAAIIIVLLALNLSYNWLEKKSLENTIIALSDIPKDQKDTIYTEKGVKAKIVLPDGSKVWLNSDTKIIYPNRFLGKVREVILSGEAYFEVEKDSLCPMIVRTNKNFRIEVLGTKFNIKSYENDKESQATLYSGRIRLVTNIGEKETITSLNPNESVIIKENIIQHVSNPEEIAIKTAWKEGDLIFDSVKFSDVIKIIERWHGVSFIIQNPSLLNEVISANFHSESVIQIMELLKYSVKFDYEINNNIVIIK
jgi:ferric-dicitrate binding protein FerR (iron transport regulator)